MTDGQEKRVTTTDTGKKPTEFTNSVTQSGEFRLTEESLVNLSHPLECAAHEIYPGASWRCLCEFDTDRDVAVNLQATSAAKSYRWVCVTSITLGDDTCEDVVITSLGNSKVMYWRQWRAKPKATVSRSIMVRYTISWMYHTLTSPVPLFQKHYTALGTWALLIEQKHTDMNLVLDDGSKIAVHRVILAGGLPWFDRLFRQSSFADSSNGDVSMPHLSKRAMRRFLFHIYWPNRYPLLNMASTSHSTASTHTIASASTTTTTAAATTSAAAASSSSAAAATTSAATAAGTAVPVASLDGGADEVEANGDPVIADPLAAPELQLESLTWKEWAEIARTAHRLEFGPLLGWSTKLLACHLSMSVLVEATTLANLLDLSILKDAVCDFVKTHTVETLQLLQMCAAKPPTTTTKRTIRDSATKSTEADGTNKDNDSEKPAKRAKRSTSKRVVSPEEVPVK